MKEKELTVKELIQKMQGTVHFLLSKWKIIVLIGFLGGSIGFYKSFTSIPIYSATVKFAVEEESKGGGLASLASNFGFGGVGSGGSLYSSSNIIELLKTRSMVEIALLRPIRENNYKKTTYAELYIKSSDMSKGWNRIPKLKKINYKIGDTRDSFSREKDSILGVIYSSLIDKGMLSVQQPNEDISIINLDVKSQNEIFAKNFAIELMEVVAEHYLKSKTQKTQASIDVLQGQTDSVKAELYLSMGSAASETDAVFGLNPAMNIKRVSSAKQQAQAQINAAVLQELVKNLEMTKMKLRDETPVITIIDNPIYPLKNEKLGKTKAIMVGGLVAGFLIALFLVLRRYFKSVMNE